MPKKLRQRIFYSLIVLFLVLGTGVVLYAKGWRVEFKPFGIGRVGGIYVRTFPTDAALALNGESEERSSGLFDKGTLLNDLLPDTYSLTVSDNGFDTWRMQAAVQSSLVTTFPYVVLVPTNTTPATTTAVQNIASAGRTLVLTTAAGMETLSGTRIPGTEILSASQDGTVILTYAPATHSYFETDLSQATTTNLGQLPGQLTTNAAAFAFLPVPGDNTLFLVQSPQNLELLRVPTAEVLPLATTTVSAAGATAGRVAWATYDLTARTSIISYYDISSQEFSSDIDSVPGRITQILFSDQNDLFVVTNDGSLYSLSLGQSSRTRLAQNVEAVTLSSDNNQLAVLDTQAGGIPQVQVFFLNGDQPNIQISLPDAAKATGLSWYRDDEHLFVIYPDHASFLDLADPTLQDYFTVAPTGTAMYTSDNNTLYFLKDNMVEQLAFPSS